MNKVKCVNNHFFDLDKFNTCPFCGAGVSAGAAPQNNKSSFSGSVRRSRLVGTQDKTEILTEPNQNRDVPAQGKAGGIIWNFNTSSKTPAHSQNRTSVQSIDETMMETDTKAPNTQPAAPTFTPAPAATNRHGTSLMQDVANTGHGTTSALPKTVAYYDQVTAEEIAPPTGWLVCIRGAHKGQAFQCKENKNRIGRGANCTIVPDRELSINREVHATLYFDPKHVKFYLSEGDGDGLVRVNDELVCGKTMLNAYDKIELGKAEFVFVPLCGEQFSWEDYKD